MHHWPASCLLCGGMPHVIVTAMPLCQIHVGWDAQDHSGAPWWDECTRKDCGLHDAGNCFRYYTRCCEERRTIYKLQGHALYCVQKSWRHQIMLWRSRLPLVHPGTSHVMHSILCKETCSALLCADGIAGDRVMLDVTRRQSESETGAAPRVYPVACRGAGFSSKQGLTGCAS